MKGRITPAILQETAKQLYPLFENYTEVARILNLPPTTARDIIMREDNYQELRGQQKKLLIQEGHQKAVELLRAIDPKKAKSLSELAITYGTVVDKNAVLAGENARWSNQVNVDNRKVEIKISPKLQNWFKNNE